MDSKEKIKLIFLRLIDSLLSKYLACHGCFGLLIKLKKLLVHMFCMIFPYKCSLFNTLSMYKVSMPCLFSFSRYQTKCVIKGGLGSDDLTILNCFRVIFSLKMKTIQFSLSFNLYFQQKRAPKLAICHLSTKRSVRVFDIINRRNDFTSFQSYNQVVMYSLTH